MILAMLDPTHRRVLNTARIVTLAFCLACVLYALVAALTLGQRTAVTGSRAVLVPSLLAVAGMGLVAAQLVHQVMLTRGVASGATGWFIATVVGQALREGAALMGLVLTLLTGQLVYVVACSAVAVAVMLAAFPRESALEDHLRSGRL